MGTSENLRSCGNLPLRRSLYLLLVGWIIFCTIILSERAARANKGICTKDGRSTCMQPAPLNLWCCNTGHGENKEAAGETRIGDLLD